MPFMTTAENKIMRQRLASAYVSSVISISLVLLLVGVASLLLINAGNVSAYFKENMKISVVFKQEATQKQAMAYTDRLSSQEYVRECTFVSKEEGIREMEELLGADFLSVFDTAPVPMSVNVSLKAEYMEPGIMEDILTKIGSSPIVDEVVWQKSLVEALNANLRTISMVLSVLIGLLLFISFMLINNTVRLNIFSKRFTVHTMRLVGATKAFIRRPFLVESVFQGLIAALVSIVMLIGILLFIKGQFPQMFNIFQLQQCLAVIGIVIASGILICLLSTFAVVGRLVTLKRDELY